MGTEETFDVEAFEKRLKNLKDTQEGIQGLSAWCLLNHVHHKKIVTAWLNVLKQGTFFEFNVGFISHIFFIFQSKLSIVWYYFT